MNEPKTYQEAHREKEVRDALTLSDRERLIMRDKAEWKLRGIDDIVQQALFEKCLPLFMKIYNEIDRQEAAIERLKKKM